MSELLKREKMARALFEVGAPPHQFWDDVGLDKRELYLCMADAALSQGSSAPAPRPPLPADLPSASDLADAIASADWSGVSIGNKEMLKAVIVHLRANQPDCLNFFSENVDRWGALEWFNRMAKAIREQDVAVRSNDDAGMEICRNVAASSAMRLVREYEQQVRAALSRSAASTVEPVPIYQCMATDDDENCRDIWMDVRKELFEEVGKRPDMRTRIVYAAPTTSPEPDAVREALRDLVAVVGSMKVPQNPMDAGLQIMVTVGPSLDRALAALSHSAHGGWKDVNENTPHGEDLMLDYDGVVIIGIFRVSRHEWRTSSGDDYIPTEHIRGWMRLPLARNDRGSEAQ